MSGHGLQIDASPALYPAGGIGRYTRDLLAALETDPDAPPATFVYPRDLPGIAPPWPAGRVRALPWGSRRMRTLWVLSARAGLRPDAWYGRPAVFHDPAARGPLFAHARLIVTVHDLTGLLHPEWHPARTAFLVRHTLPQAVRHAERILCDSEFVRGQVIRELGADPARVETVLLSVDPSFAPISRAAAEAHVRERCGIDGPFVLQVGTIEPRKNHVGTVAAFERMRRAGFPGRLVLVGHPGWRVEPILQRLEGSPEAGAIVRLSGVDDADLKALYSACTAWAFPSFDEGFGLPPLEAMACGAPGVTSNGSSLPEVVGDGALMVPPGDVDALADGLLRLWRDADARAALGARARAQAARFGRERFVRRMFEIYRALLSDARASA